MCIIRLIRTGNGASLSDGEGGNRGSGEMNEGGTEGIIFLGWDYNVWLSFRTVSLLGLSLLTRGGLKRVILWNLCDQHVNTAGWWLAAVCFYNSSVYKKPRKGTKQTWSHVIYASQPPWVREWVVIHAQMDVCIASSVFLPPSMSGLLAQENSTHIQLFKILWNFGLSHDSIQSELFLMNEYRLWYDSESHETLINYVFTFKYAFKNS